MAKQNPAQQNDSMGDEELVRGVEGAGDMDDTADDEFDDAEDMDEEEDEEGAF